VRSIRRWDEGHHAISENGSAGRAGNGIRRSVSAQNTGPNIVVIATDDNA
jgi:hypothetical protein